MNITLYRYNGPANVINKQLGLVSKTITGVKLKEPTSMLNPVLEISENISDMCGYNYVAVPDLGRFYFITDCVSTGYNLTTMSCTVDVLYSFAGQINMMSGTVCRSSKQGIYDMYLEDPEFICSAVTDYVQKDFSGGDDLANTSTILVLGGAVEEEETP